MYDHYIQINNVWGPHLFKMVGVMSIDFDTSYCHERIWVIIDKKGGDLPPR